jgi:hypothetical protein
VQFATLFPATIPDGEVEISNVQVIAQISGLSSNVSNGDISSFVSPPFTGATVTNPLPFTNGQPTEDDNTFRERIRAARQSRVKGTALAITTALQDVVASDEDKRIASSSVVAREGTPTTVYIDDGTGYEETATGIAIESLMASATGGEKYFQIQNRPLAKAALITTATAPFKLADAQRLAVSVGGAITEHVFSAEEFKNVSNATAYEVAASINADPNITFSASTSGGGTQVRIFAREDENEDIQVVSASVFDANAALQFPAELQQTLWLAKNDVLLSKDGEVAALSSNPISQWGALASGETLTISIDGTAAATYTFVDQDFVDAQSGFTTVGVNTLAAWATVINFKIPGVTATATDGILTITSNAGRSSRAKLAITGGSLVTKQVLPAGNAAGRDRDYTLNRNTGQIRLALPLAAGDSLSAGTENSRPFIQSSALSVVTVSGTPVDRSNDLYFVVDGNAQLVPTGALAGVSLQVTDYGGNATPGFMRQVQLIAGSGTPFSNVRAGDWLIAQDNALNSQNTGFWRVSYAQGNVVEVQRATYAPETVTLTSPQGLVFVRTAAQMQWVGVNAGTYTAASLADFLNAKLVGATAEVYKTNRIRVRTNSFDGGDIALVGAWGDAKGFGLPIGSAVRTASPHFAAIQSVANGTPLFASHLLDTVGNDTEFYPYYAFNEVNEGDLFVFDRSSPFTAPDTYGSTGAWGNNTGFATPITHLDHSGLVVDIRNAPPSEVLWDERWHGVSPYAIGASDSLVLVVDQDPIGHRYEIPFWRKLVPASSTYGQTNAFKDADNAGATLATAFGLDFDFTDFAVMMPARALSDASDSTKSILWRYKRLGADGESARVRYVYPEVPNTALSIVSDHLSGLTTDITVTLPSGALKTGASLHSFTTHVGLAAESHGTNYNLLTYVLGYSVASATRTTYLDYNRTSNSGGAANGTTVTGATSGATATVTNDVLDTGLLSGTGLAHLTLSGVSGTFQNGETLTFSTNPPTGTAINSQFQRVRLTVTLPTSSQVGDHGWSLGGVPVSIYLQSASSQFPSGLKTMTRVAGSQTDLSYVEAGTDGTVTNIGTVSWDTSEATFSTLTPGLAVGDILQVGAAGLDPNFEHTIRVTAFGPQWVQAYYAGTFTTSQTSIPVWGSLTDATAIKIYPLTNSTASQISSAVNALDSSPVTATLTGDGSGQIESSDESAQAPNTWYQLADGLNWILDVTYPATEGDDYQFTFKKNIASSLATGSDWLNEQIRVVPNQALTIVRWLNSPAVTGLSNACSIALSSGAVQISTLTSGSSGAIQAQGGTATEGTAAVSGTAVLAGSSTVVTVPKADADSFTAGIWVRAQNAVAMPKSIFAGSTSLTSISTAGVFVVSGTPIWTYANSGPIAGKTWRVLKQGKFVALRYSIVTYGTGPDLTGVTEGSWVKVDCSDSLNAGIFQVVRVYSDPEDITFWIENPNAIEEDIVATMTFFTRDSMMPGDTLNISTDLWGNKGAWTIQFVGGTTSGTQFGNSTTFTVVGTPTAKTGPIALGAAAPLVQVIEAKPTSLIKQISAIVPNQNDSSFLDVKFSTNALSSLISEAASTVLQPLDRLAFPEDVVIGADGYRESVGLIGEANKVLYGDTRDPVTYPGVVASGARVNIATPLIKRIQVALNLRINGNRDDIKDKVRSAVASLVNQTPIGQSIAISDIIAAAGKVNGVLAVSVLSPTFSSASDQIPVQPEEKPLVLDLASDVTITFA